MNTLSNLNFNASELLNTNNATSIVGGGAVNTGHKASAKRAIPQLSTCNPNANHFVMGINTGRKINKF